MAKIIKNDNMTQAEIQQSIDSYLKQNEDFTSLQGLKSTDIVTELLAGFGSYISYNNQTLREETYAETVKSKASIAMMAIDYSYRVNRPTSPKILLEYTGAVPVNLFRGDVVGTYEGLSMVYTGDFAVLRVGSTFEVTIGDYVTKTFTIDKSKPLWTVDIVPENRKYIENSIVEVKADNVSSNIVKRLEDLYLGNAVDFSLGESKARVYLYDSKIKRGFASPESATVSVSFLEIDGIFDFVNSKAQLISKDYKINTILSQGSEADDLYYVKSILPFFNQTFRTAVSPTDFNYIVKGFNYFRDASYQFDQGVPVQYRFQLRDLMPGAEYTITLFSNKGAYKDNPKTEEYKVIASAEDTYDTLMARFVSIIESQTSLAEIIYPMVGVYFRLKALKPSSELEAYISSNIDRLREIPNRLPNQYLGYVYYTHRQIEQNIQYLTYYEQQQFKIFFEPHKISGHVVALVPATRHWFDLNLKVKIQDRKFESVFKELWKNYLAQFQYTLNKSFSVKKALRDIALFSYNGERFVTEVFSSSEEDYLGYIDRYLYLSVTLDLTFES